jgi:hypothetical protein
MMPILDLTDLDGNAFAIMGAWQRAARAAGWQPDKITAVIKDASSGDYDHLLQVILAHSESR